MLINELLRVMEDQKKDDDSFPVLLARAGEFRVEMDENEQVQIMDRAGTVKVSMPLIIWNQLRRQ